LLFFQLAEQQPQIELPLGGPDSFLTPPPKKGFYPHEILRTFSVPV
jgi:hypothetical protein